MLDLLSAGQLWVNAALHYAVEALPSLELAGK